MILTPHILVGAAIASKTSNPVLGLTLAFLSHYLVDAIPHTDYAIAHVTRRKINFSAFKEFFLALSDIVGGLILVYLLVSRNGHDQLYLLMGGFAAALPDSIHASSYVFPPRIIKILNVGHTLHSKYKNPPIFLGVLTQVGIIIISTLVLLA